PAPSLGPGAPPSAPALCRRHGQHAALARGPDPCARLDPAADRHRLRAPAGQELPVQPHQGGVHPLFRRAESGGRPCLQGFINLDTDGDGRVDLFEIFIVLAIWSGTSWEEKLDCGRWILFKLFDMMQKGFLKVDEVCLLSTRLLQTLQKFVKLDDDFTAPDFVRYWTQRAVPLGESRVSPDAFRSWVSNCEPFDRLKGFVESHAARAQPDTNASRMRVRIGVIEKHGATLLERLEHLQDKLPDFGENCIDYVTALGRRKRWDFVIQQLRELIMKISNTSESLHSTVGDLEQSLHEDEVSGGAASLVEPGKRFKQEQMLLSLDKMREDSATDFREATDLVSRLVDLTEPGDTAGMGVAELLGDSMNPINEEEQRRGGARGRRSAQGGGAPRRDAAGLRRDGRRLRGRLHLRPHCGAGRGRDAAPRAGHARGRAGAPAGRRGPALGESEPTLVAIADFEPPPSHEAQMLKLDVGDVVRVLGGQDGRGWWYGRKQSNSKEGWFPPSYVQVKPAHFTSADA
ncbi:unnamed protein product, partial [Prorocentrum cordatum]